jgi:hypothetical protein
LAWSAQNFGREFCPLEDGSDSWSIGGLAVGSARTEIAGEPQVGDLVRVQALLKQTGLTALSIESVAPAAPEPAQLMSDTADGETEFTGQVVAIGPDSWTVGDTTVAVTSDTEPRPRQRPGEGPHIVSVRAPAAKSGWPSRHSVDDSPDDSVEAGDSEGEQDLEFKGVVESISGDTWTVSGMAFLVTPDTEIKDTITVGDFVEIHAVLSVDGLLTAVSIELSGDDDSQSGDEISDDQDDDQSDDSEDQEHEDESHDESDDDAEDGGNSGSGGGGGSD